MLAPILILAAATTVALSPGAYRYAATLNGASAGTTSIAVNRDAGGQTTISEDANGSLQGIAFSGKASYVLGADNDPLSYSGNYNVAGQTPSVSATFSGQSASVSGPMSPGGGPQTFSLLHGTTHFAVIEPGLVAGLFALPVQMQAWNGAALTVIAPAYARAQPLEVQASAAPPPRPPGVPAGDAVLSFGGNLPFTIWYDPATQVPDEIDVPSQGASVSRIRGR